MIKDSNLKILSIIVFISIVLTILSTTVLKSENYYAESKLLNNNNLVLEQKVIAETEVPVVQKVLYANNKRIGVVHNLETIDAMIAEVKESDYKSDFPDAKLGFGEDVFISEEMLNFQYENIDEHIKDYIVEHKLLAIETNKITFSNGAIIYVKDIQDFENAKEDYLLNFVSEEELEYIKNHEEIPFDEDQYTSSAQSLEILEKTTLSKGFAPQERILKDKKEIVEFLSYGYGTEKDYYTVQEYDTVEGIAYQAGISPQQLVTINPQLKSKDQLIKEGEVLNVTFFDSPINVIVKKLTVKQEVVYPESTLFVEDSTLKEGTVLTTVNEEPGSRKAVYEETYVNGQLKDGSELVSVKTLKEPVREVVKLGTMVIPSVGSGKFRYPVDNVSVTCGWYCYEGHTATDLINSVNRYGPVKASDRGVVEVSSYGGINGYYVWINHNNGYKTYYGHLNSPAYVSPGQIVERGEVIGQIGMTGLATGPHVHMMITYNGTYLNPMTMFGN